MSLATDSDEEGAGNTLPVKAAEVLSGVVAALAVEQIAQGALASFYRAGAGTLSIIDRFMPLAVGFALLITVVRFFHGNAVYLAAKYGRWNPSEQAHGDWFAMPLQHALDVIAHLIQYAALVGAGARLGADFSFRQTAHWVAVLLLCDTLWTGAHLIGARGSDSGSERQTHKTWALLNAFSLFVGILAFYAVRELHAPDAWNGLSLVVVLLAAAIIDYRLNNDHYTDAKRPTETIPLEQASYVAQYLAALPSASRRSESTSPSKEELRSLFTRCCSFMMANGENRGRLFRRGSSLGAPPLHIGMYIEKDRVLHPVVRYCDSLIRPSNKPVNLNEGHLGHAFLEIGAELNKTHLWNEPVPEHALKRPSGDRKKHQQHYQSYILANVIWPSHGDGKKEIGTLILTAGKKAHFTRQVHQAMFLGVRNALVTGLEQMFGRVSAAEVQSQLLTLCAEPIVIEPPQKKKQKG